MSTKDWRLLTANIFDKTFHKLNYLKRKYVMSNTKVDLNDFELVPVKGEYFVQQLPQGKSQPIETKTFKVLLLAAEKALDYANQHLKEDQQERALRNRNYYFNQVNMDEGDAFSLYLNNVSDWTI